MGALEEERQKEIAAMRPADPNADLLLTEDESESDSEESGDEAMPETSKDSHDAPPAAMKVEMDARTAAGESPEAEGRSRREPTSPEGSSKAKVEPARELEPDVEAIIDDVF